MCRGSIYLLAKGPPALDRSKRSHPRPRLHYSVAGVKAIVISRLGGPEVLEVRAVPDPVPGEGQALVRVKAGGVNFADIMTAQGGYPGTPEPPFCGRAGILRLLGRRRTDGDGIHAVGRIRRDRCRALRAALARTRRVERRTRRGLSGQLFHGILCLLEGRLARKDPWARHRGC